MNRFRVKYSNPVHPASAIRPGRSVVSVDIGTRNLCIGRISQLKEGEGKYQVEHLVVLDLTDEDGARRDIDTIGTNLFLLLNSNDLQWMWSPPSPVIVERQVDQIKSVAQRDGKRFSSGIMFAVYGMMKQIVLAHRSPCVLDSEANNRLAIDWVPRSGSQKFGLKDVHGDQRKSETLTRGPEVAREQGDLKFAAHVETLGKPKPREDACDAYLQALHYLEELEEKERKEERKATRKRKAEAITSKRPEKKRRLIDLSEKADSLEL